MTPVPARAHGSCLEIGEGGNGLVIKMQHDYAFGFEQKKTTFRGGLNIL